MVSLYLCGSVELNDFSQRESDLDLIAVCKGKLKKPVIQRLRNMLAHNSLPCPAMGVELYIIRKKQVISPVKYPVYEMLMRTGATWDLQVRSHQIETDLLIDLAICRQKGRVIKGSPPHKLIAEIPRNWLLHAMYQSLQWRHKHLMHPFHDPHGENAVLNACRAWCYKIENRFCSKTEAGEWAIKQCQHDREQELIRQALMVRQGVMTGSLDVYAVDNFLRKVKSSLYTNWFLRWLGLFD